MRRMEPPGGEGGGGGSLMRWRLREVSAGMSAWSTELICATWTGLSVRAARAGGTVVLDSLTWQQRGAACIAAQSCIPWRQQAWCAAGMKHANAGAAAQRATSISIRAAYFLLTSTV